MLSGDDIVIETIARGCVETAVARGAKPLCKSAGAYQVKYVVI